MRIGHIEVIDRSGKVLMVYPIRSSDNRGESDERRKRFKLAERVIDKACSIKLYDQYGTVIDSREIGCLISVKV